MILLTFTQNSCSDQFLLQIFFSYFFTQKKFRKDHQNGSGILTDNQHVLKIFHMKIYFM